jgi:hypothetical protein
VEGMELPSVGEWAATSPHSLQVLNQKSKQGGCATSWECGLPPQGCATSPRGAHLSITCANIFQDITQSNANQYDLCPL